MLSPKTVEKWVGEVKDRALLGRLEETINRLFEKPVEDVHADLVNLSFEEKRRLESARREIEAQKYKAISEATGLRQALR